MDSSLYQYTIALYIALFLLARAVAFWQYRKLFRPKQRTMRSSDLSLMTDKILVIINGICWTVLPALWASGYIQYGNFEIPEAWRILGVLMCLSGVAGMWICNLHLKDNWSAIAEIKRDHALITKGIYRYIRHPMYSAFFLIVFGLLFCTANWLAGGIAVAAWQILYFYRIDREEALLLNEFGKQYIHYIAHSGRLLPSNIH